MIELLVVVLIIGILAAIALPAFLDQRKKGQDSDAKSNARNLVSHVEACFAKEQDYQLCDASPELPETGIPYGANAGEARVTSAVERGFTVVAVSKASSGGASHRFSIIRGDVSDAYTRQCSPAGSGACHSDASW